MAEQSPPRGGTQDVFYPRSATGDIPTIVRGEGVYLYDDQGRRLLDVSAGPFLAALGQGNRRVLAAMAEQGRQLTYVYSRMTRHPANVALAERLATLAGPRFERVHLSSGGSESVDDFMAASTRGVFPSSHNDRRTEASTEFIASVDRTLIEDGTDFVAGVDGALVACGGSRCPAARASTARARRSQPHDR